MVHNHGHLRPHDHARRRPWAKAATVLAMLGLLGLPFLASTAYADDAAQQDATTSTPSGGDTDHGTAVSMTIDEATPVVTATSGYHIKVSITNPTAEALTSGRMSLHTNVLFSFSSRTDIQEWSQGQSPIPTFDELGTTNVPDIAPHATANVTMDVAASQDKLKTIVNWGPKPLLVSYERGQDAPTVVHTFLTRSSEGLPNAQTPALNITMAMPLAGDSWQLNQGAAKNLMTGQRRDAMPNVDDVVTLGDSGTRLARDKEELIDRHPKLQVVADPTYLKALSLPTTTNAIMQPGFFDLTSAAALNDSQAYERSGVASAAWSATTAADQYQRAVGDKKAAQPAYAWQGSGQWTVQALNHAKSGGYPTVIADQGFNDDDDATVHTGKYVLPTDSGDVTVLASQRELTTLARGHATSRQADGETSSAGRLSRFMAQSAFYQMEQPYTTRTLLVCFDVDTSVTDENALLGAMEHASWLSLSSLDDLAQAEPYRSGEEAAALAPTSSGLSSSKLGDIASTLRGLAASRDDISRFSSDILQEDTATASKPKTADAGDAQSLAQQDANSARSKDGRAWITRIGEIHDQLALHAMSANTALRERASGQVNALADQLLSGVAITPMEKITVVSETAGMPVSISNTHPYPVKVKVSSLTDSMEIVTNRFVTVEVPARGNAQVTFTIRVSTSGRTTAHLTLLDRQGKAFSSPQETPIISTLQISDMSGFIFIAIAIVLGIVGLWRQFHRKKDPDE